VHTRGGLLTIEWDGGAVRMTGPAELFLKARSTFLTSHEQH
jgi:diaminopimelate epimerase